VVPVERLGQLQPVRGLQTEAVDIGDEDQQSGELLSALDDAELGRLLIELIVSPPALARPMIFALDDCACSRKEEKSGVLSGARTLPRILPPLSSTTLTVSRSRAWPKA